MLLIAISELNCRRIVANEYSVRHAFHTVNTEEAEIPAVSLAPAMPATTNQQYDPWSPLAATKRDVPASVG